MYDSEIRLLFSGGIFINMVFQYAYHIRCLHPAALGGGAGRFDTDDDLFIFIYNIGVHFIRSFDLISLTFQKNLTTLIIV